jgi:probable addiction module antidote protein
MNTQFLESLKDPETATAYLNKALENDDSAILVQALRNVITAYGGVVAVAEKANVKWEQLERILQEENKPKFVNIQFLLRALNMHFTLIDQEAS